MTDDGMDCAHLAAIDAELALGVVDARTRAAAIRHLERCSACRRRVRRLTEVSELLPELVPPAEPPEGFESRVLSRIRHATPSVGRTRSHRARGAVRRRRSVIAATATVVLLAGVVGWFVGTSGSTPGPATSPAASSGHVVTADLVGHHRTLGEVVLVAGHVPWLSMALRSGVGGGTVRCQAVVGSGRDLTLGTFSVVDGHGYWASALPPGTTVQAVRVVSSSGAVLATAQISSWTP